MSQGRLAKELRVTPGYLSLLEHEKREPSLTFLREASGYFGVPIALFLLHQDEAFEKLKGRNRELVSKVRDLLLDYLIARESEGNPTKRKRK
jgi:transcriptional regulator with XRE-family HTH domain